MGPQRFRHRAAGFRREVEVAERGGYRYAYLETEGPYSKLGSKRGEVDKKLREQGVDIFLVLATVCAVFLYISYAIPVIAGFFAEVKSWTVKGPFNLGKLSKPIALISGLGVLLLATTGFFPPNTPVFYLTLGMIVILPILWFAGMNKSFEGVPQGEKIKERQKMIAEIEKKYGEGD